MKKWNEFKNRRNVNKRITNENENRNENRRMTI